MTEKISNTALEVSRYLLCGTYLDNIRVYSSSIEICFSRLNEQEKPSEIWVTSTAAVRVCGPSITATFAAGAVLDQRGVALYMLCQLIGEDVTSVQILDDRLLDFSLGGCEVRLYADEANTEEVWSITSDSPDPMFKHRWSITLDELGDLVVCVPARSDL